MKRMLSLFVAVAFALSMVGFAFAAEKAAAPADKAPAVEKAAPAEKAPVADNAAKAKKAEPKKEKKAEPKKEKAPAAAPAK